MVLPGASNTVDPSGNGIVARCPAGTVCSIREVTEASVESGVDPRASHQAPGTITSSAAAITIEIRPSHDGVLEE